MSGRSEFPFSKLMYMIVRQASRPIAKRVRQLAEKSPVFKKYVCLPPAFFYMWSQRVVDDLARGGPAKAVPPYVEKKAVRLGSNLIGEFCIFGIAATFITLEFMRQRRKRRQRMEEEMLEKDHLRRRAMEAAYNRDRRRTELKDLQERAEDMQRRLLGDIELTPTDERTQPDSVSGIRIEDAYLARGVKVRAYGGADVEKKMRSAAEAARTVATLQGHDKEAADLKARVAAMAVRETSTPNPEQRTILNKTRGMEKSEKQKKVDKGAMTAGSSTRGASQVAVALEAPTIKDDVAERQKILKEVEKHVEDLGVLKTPEKDEAKTTEDNIEAPTELELAIKRENPLESLELHIEKKDEKPGETENLEETHSLETEYSLEKEYSQQRRGKSLVPQDQGIVDETVSEPPWYSLDYVFGLERRQSTSAARTSSNESVPSSDTNPESEPSQAPVDSPPSLAD